MIRRNLLAVYLMAFSQFCFALPLTLAPVGTLPTGVIKGFPVTAGYTVTNNTNQSLNNLTVRTPPNVTVKTTGCGTTFNLASGASCTLYLSITGEVNAADPNPKHHLFVCLPGGTSCTGTYYPLNVAKLASPLNIYAGSAETNGNFTVCSVDSDSAVLSDCTATGTGASFTKPEWSVFTASAQQAFITDAGAAKIWLCGLTPSTGLLSNCEDTQVSALTTPAGIALNAEGTKAYIADTSANRVYLCSVDLLTSALSNCADSGAGAIFNSPKGIALNPGGTVAFIANSGNGTIAGCSINATTGQLGSCTNTTGFAQPTGITFTTADTAQGILAYVTDASATSIYVCSVSGNSLSCSAAASYTYNGTSYVAYTFSSPRGIALAVSRAANQPPQIAQIYVANNTGGTIALCNYCQSDCPGSAGAGTLICSDSPISAINNIIGLTLLS